MQLSVASDSSAELDDLPPRRYPRFGAATQAYFAERELASWSLSGGYMGFVRGYRKQVLRLSERAAVKIARAQGHSLRVCDLQGHEDVFYWQHEASVPAVAAYLGLEVAHLTKVFRWSKRVDGH